MHAQRDTLTLWLSQGAPRLIAQLGRQRGMGMTPDQKSAFDDEGFVIIERFFSATELGRLLEVYRTPVHNIGVAQMRAVLKPACA